MSSLLSSKVESIDYKSYEYTSEEDEEDQVNTDEIMNDSSKKLEKFHVNNATEKQIIWNDINVMTMKYPASNFTTIEINEDKIRKILNEKLSTDFNAILRSEENFLQRNNKIVLSESALVDECLMLLSGLRSSLLFKYSNNDFSINEKFRSRHLNKELKECLREVIYYSKVIMNLEKFAINCVNNSENSTQVYESFSQCIIEYLRYFKENLNKYGSIVVAKESKFTLVDFLNKIREPFFEHFDILSKCLAQIESDKHSTSHQKSINLLILIHKYLTDLFKSRSHLNINSKFLSWLFTRLMDPFLSFIDTFIQEGHLLDAKFELGFKRNEKFKLNSADYWRFGFELVINESENAEYLKKLPMFILIIVSSSFKICKHMEIIKLLGNYNVKSDIYESFLKEMKRVCPFLIENSNHLTNNSEIQHPDSNNNQGPCTKLRPLLEINFKQLNDISSTEPINAAKNKHGIVSIDSLIKNHNYLVTNNHEGDAPIMFDLEKIIQDNLNDSFLKYLKFCANILIEKFFYKYHMIEFFEFLHSYFLFKSNEIIFLFSKNLFDTIKSYETYQEEAILNKIYYDSSNSIFTTATLMKNTAFGSNLITIGYDESSALKQSSELSSRLVNSIRLKIKICWPLNILIKESNIESYNRVFLFNLQLKQAKYDLDSLVLKDMDVKRYKKTNLNFIQASLQQPDLMFDELTVNKVLLIRFKLMNFINGLHDLICSQIYELSKQFLITLNQQTDIDEIIDIHEKFLRQLVKSCLLDHKFFQKSIFNIFNEILVFCDMWRRGINYFTSSVSNNINELEKNLNLYYGWMFKILSTLLNKNQSNTHIQSLIAVLEQLNY